MGFDAILTNLVIAVPVFFLSKLIFKRIEDKKTRAAATWVSTLILTPIIYIGLIIAWVYAVTDYPKVDFDKTKWAADIEKRYEMTDDLVDNEKLTGKTKDEIIELLGLEDNTQQSNQWTYYIGFRPRLFSVDPDILVIEFKNGKVFKCSTRNT
jgi:hypothetical protein